MLTPPGRDCDSNAIAVSDRHVSNATRKLHPPLSTLWLADPGAVQDAPPGPRASSAPSPQRPRADSVFASQLGKRKGRVSAGDAAREAYTKRRWSGFGA